MNALIGILALVVLALVGWAVAEFKNRYFGYTVSEEEIEAAHHEAAHRSPDGTEMNIKDVIKTISTKGYTSV